MRHLAARSRPALARARSPGRAARPLAAPAAGRPWRVRQAATSKRPQFPRLGPEPRELVLGLRSESSGIAGEVREPVSAIAEPVLAENLIRAAHAAC
jgi:hypothetical protein